MRRRKRLPPDTRPKWDDPNLSGPFGWELADLKFICEVQMEGFDKLSRPLRDAENYSIDGVTYVPDGFKRP